MNRPSPRDSARHEAAHGLVAWFCRIPLKTCGILIKPVTLEETRFVTLGITRLADAEDAKLNDLLRSQSELTGEAHDYMTRHLLFAVAGFVAEQHAGTTSQETTGADRRTAMLIAGRIGGGRIVGEGISSRVDLPADRKLHHFRLLSDAEERVQKLLADHEEAWDGLASLLMQHGSLTGEQIAQFLTTQIGRRDR